MAGIRDLQDGVSYPHDELMTTFGFKTERAMKNFVMDHDIPYLPVNGVWWIAGEDARKAMRSKAKTHAQRREEKEEVEA